MQPKQGFTESLRTSKQKEDRKLAQIQQFVQQHLGPRRYEHWCQDTLEFSRQGQTLVLYLPNPFLLNFFRKNFLATWQEAAGVVLGKQARVELSLAPQAETGDRVERPHESHDPKTKNSAKRTETIQQKSTNLSHSSTMTLASQSASHVSERSAAPRTARGSTMTGRRAQTEHSSTIPPVSLSASATPRQTTAPRQRRLADLQDFLPSPHNEPAWKAALRMSEGAPVPYQLMYLYGPVGSGKTHLLEGICKRASQRAAGRSVLLISAEGFANLFTQALQERTVPAFRQRFRHVDLLLVDDVQFFEGKRILQEEFHHTLVELLDHDRQIVVTADRHPQLLTRLSEELVSRFRAGLISRLELPDEPTRVQIVKHKARKLTAEFTADALQYVAQKMTRSVRELEGALNCLQTHYDVTHQRITLPVARKVLTELERDCRKMIRLDDVEHVVCDLFRVKPKELRSNSRVRSITHPRMLAMYLSRKLTQAAYSEIGAHYGGRNHSTVMAAERKVDNWLKHDSLLHIAGRQWSARELLHLLEHQLLAT